MSGFEASRFRGEADHGITILPPEGQPYLASIGSESGDCMLFGQCLATLEEIEQGAHRANWGDARPLTDLPGNYSGVWTGNEETIAFSGLSGQFGLHYYESDARTIVGLDPAAVANEAGAELDRATLAAQVCLPMGLLRERYSSFQGVQKLGAGELLRANAQGLAKETYETFAPAPHGSIEAAAVATEAALVEALERRLATFYLTSDFSGGLDSSSLACMAALLGHREEPVKAFFQYHPNYRSGDYEYAYRFAKAFPRIVLCELVETDRELPFSIVSPFALPFNPSEPYRTASIYGRQSQRIRAVDETPSTLHLTGTGGDALYASEPFIADLLLRGEDERFEADGTILSRLRYSSPEAYKRQAREHAGHTLPQAWQKLADVLGGLISRDSFDVGWLPTLNRNLDWLTPEMRRLLQERAQAEAERAQTDLLIGDYRTIGQILDSGDAQRHLMSVEGRRVHAPYLDHRVIRAALECEAYERTQAGRQSKPVLKKALKKNYALPPELLERRDKGNYTFPLAAGLRHAQASLLLLLQKSRLAALGIIDPDAIGETLQYHETGGRGKASFDQFLAAEVWLRQREEFLGEYVGNPPFTAEFARTVGTVLAQKTAPVEGLSCAAGPGEQMLLMDTGTGGTKHLIKTEAVVFRALNDTDDPEEAVRRLAARYPQLPSHRIRADVANVVQGMLQRGWLTQDIDKEGLPQIFRPQFVKEWKPDALDEPLSPKSLHRRQEASSNLPPDDAERRIGHRALATACELRGRGFFATKSYLWEIRLQIPPIAAVHAEPEKVLRYREVLRQLSYEPDYAKQRIACYELSVATVLMAAAQNIDLHWVVGVAFGGAEPMVHTWAEDVHSTPIVDADDELHRFTFQKLFRT